MRSWRSTAAQSPGTARRPRRARCRRCRRARARRGRTWMRRAPRSRRGPRSTSPATRRRRRRRPATAGRGTSRGQLGARFTVGQGRSGEGSGIARGREASRSDVGVGVARLGRRTSAARASSAWTRCFFEKMPRKRCQYILRKHEEAGETTGERSHDHAAGAGIEIAQHPPDCSATFTVRSLAGHPRYVFNPATRSVCVRWPQGVSATSLGVEVL